MLLYAHTITPRLRYIAEWFQEHYLEESLELTDLADRYKSHEGPRINYSAHRIAETECWIEPSPLLFEDSILPIELTVCSNGFSPFFFAGRGDMDFDVLAAGFYLISRYEEYLPHEKDAYGRFAHVQSIAFRHRFLNRPLVDEWMDRFCNCLRSYYPELKLKQRHFQFQATYDIDESFAYSYKSVGLHVAGITRDLIRGRFDWVTERIRTLRDRQADPYDSFSFLSELHQSIGARPICFLHVAKHRGAYDKNVSPGHPAQQVLIRSIANWSDIGLHPSWQSGDRIGLLQDEKSVLEDITQSPIYRSRQHFIRFQLPDTFHALINLGITDDYSMGYGSINGFRASTTRSFYWFDLCSNVITSLRIHPFCYMDANSFYELGHTIDQAEREWTELEQAVRSVNGRMIVIWHNNFLGTQKRFAGWRDRYANWLQSLQP